MMEIMKNKKYFVNLQRENIFGKYAQGFLC